MTGHPRRHWSFHTYPHRMPTIGHRAVAHVSLLVLAFTLVACGGSPADGGVTTAPASPTEQDAADARDEAGEVGAVEDTDDATADEPPTEPPDADRQVTCGPIENPPQQAGSHLIGDTEPPIPYSSTPPTSGWHTSGAFEVRIHDSDDPLSEPAQVSVLEAEGVVVTYHDLPEDALVALHELVREHYDGQVAVTPYAALEEGEVALTAWGTLQRCDGLDLDVVTAFIDAHVGDDVSPGHSH
jgi:hypothetical protein